MSGDRRYPAAFYTAMGAWSQGTCYYPECRRQLVVDIRGRPVMDIQIAHIEGLKPGSARYRAEMTDEERNAWSNLLPLCEGHHKEVDRFNPGDYSVDTLQRWKRQREQGSLNALNGLNGLTEARLQEIIEQAIEQSPDLSRSLNLSIEPQVSPLAGCDFSHAAVEEWLSVERESVLAGLGKRLSNPQPTWMTSDRRTPQRFRDEVDAYIEEARSSLCSAMANAMILNGKNLLRLRVVNDADRYLNDVIVRIRIGYAVVLDPDEVTSVGMPARPRRFGTMAPIIGVTPNWMLRPSMPTIKPWLAITHSQDAIRQYAEVRYNLGDMPPGEEEVTDPVGIFFHRQPNQKELRVDWSITSKGVHVRQTGEWALGVRLIEQGPLKILSTYREPEEDEEGETD